MTDGELVERARAGDREWEEAADAASRGLALGAPTDFERQDLQMVLAVAAANLGHADQAIEHLREATTPQPEPPDADQWPFPVAVAPDHFLQWARANVGDLLAPIADDSRLGRILGESP